MKRFTLSLVVFGLSASFPGFADSNAATAPVQRSLQPTAPAQRSLQPTAPVQRSVQPTNDLLNGTLREDRNGGGFENADVQGAYSFSFEGSAAGGVPVAALGVVVADGNGRITSGVRTLNVNGEVARQTFTCSYSVNPDGTGSAECPIDKPLPGAPAVESFDFVLEDGARAFRLIGTTMELTVLGSGAKQQDVPGPAGLPGQPDSTTDTLQR